LEGPPHAFVALCSHYSNGEDFSVLAVFVFAIPKTAVQIPMPLSLIALGSNLGDRQRTLDEAMLRLGRHPHIRVVAEAPPLETAPAGGPPGQSAYVNSAALLETSLAVETLFGVLQKIEADLGRRPGERWGPRPIDLDLLLYDRLVLSTPTLAVPHPRMAWRRFVLEPAARIAGAMVHPTTGWTIARLLDHLDTTPWYAAITGSIAAGKTHLARQVAQATGARLMAEQPNFQRLAAFYANSAGHAWEMELEFLARRAELLAAGGAEWSDKTRATVSDFWFDQSAAFARVWLPPEQWEAYRARWKEARRRVAGPRLVVFLEAAGEELVQRVERRGRACERGLSADQLDRIGQSIFRQAIEPDQGPLLRLSGADADAARAEVVAAIEAMR
jgi:2-amino-4-hydroxy-6-hydroxymethyldihydropteridine diphosphokinase